MSACLISRPQSNYSPFFLLHFYHLSLLPFLSFSLSHAHTGIHPTSSDPSLTEELLNKSSAQGINNVKDLFLYQMLWPEGRVLCAYRKTEVH